MGKVHQIQVLQQKNVDLLVYLIWICKPLLFSRRLKNNFPKRTRTHDLLNDPVNEKVIGTKIEKQVPALLFKKLF